MSNSVDNRVVDMQFNNRQFESGVSDSLKTIDKLKASLDFDGSAKSLENLGRAGKTFSLAGMTEGVEMVAQKFSALEAIALGALMRIGAKIADIGMRMVKDFAIAPITQGFGEYELKMNSIQTMMLGSGESLETVNRKLEELNTYADRTIYSFSDMTANIGKFVNAGVDLDKSVAAIQGVSNVAAVSGANANEASRAMYNFSQALSKGFVQLIDWKSIENANMATVEFKQQLIDSAVAAGSLTKVGEEYKTKTGQMVTATKNFNDSLKDQWMTSDVLTETLARYADETTEIGAKAFKAAQEVKTFSQLIDTIKESVGSGWAQTWEIVFGNFDEAKKLLSGINSVVDDFVGRMTKARNDVLQGWKDAGGRDTLIEGLAAAFKNLGAILAPIGEAFRNVFPPITSQTLLLITERFRDLMVNFKMGEETSDKLRRVFEGLFTFVKLLAQGLGFLVKVAGAVASTLAPVGEYLFDLAARLGDFIVSLSGAADEGEAFVQALDWVRAFLKKISDGVTAAVDKIKEKFEQFKDVDLGPLTAFTEKVELRFRPFTLIASMFAAAFEVIAKVFKWAAPVFIKLGGLIGDAFGGLADRVGAMVSAGDFQGLLDLINTVLLGGIMVGIKKFTGSFASIADSAGSITGGFVNILDGVRGALEAYQTKLKAQALLMIAIAIGILAASLFVLATIPSEQLTSALVGITALFVELAAMMLVLSKNMGSVKLGKVAGQMLIMSAAILVLSIALKNLASLSIEDLTKGIVGIGALAAILVLSAEILSKGAPKMIKGGVGMIAFAAAILILSESVEKLSGLSWGEMIQGLVGVAAMFLTIAGFMKIMPDQKRMITTGIGMIAIGAAMLIFAEAVERMGQLSWEEIGKGLTTMAGALGIIAGALNLMPKGMINKGVALIALGAALLIIASAVEKMGGMEWIEIARGLTAMAGALLIIAGALNLMPKGMVKKAVGLIGIAAALMIMAEALKIMGGMTWEELAIGMIALAGGLAAMAIAANLMTSALPGAAAILVLSPALLLLAAALKILGSMSLEEIGLALLALVGVFAVVGVAALVLAPVVPIILALSVAIGLLGVGVLAIGAGLLLFSAGLTALSIAGTAGTAALVLLVTGLIGLIPMAIEVLINSLILAAVAIGEAAPELVAAAVVLIMALCDGLIEVIPSVVEVIMTLIGEVLSALEENIYEFVDMGMNIIISLIEGIANNAQDLVAEALRLLAELLSGIAEGLPDVISAGVDIVAALLQGISDELPRVLEAGANFIIDVINKMGDTIREKTPELVKAMTKLAGDIIQGLIDGMWEGIVGIGEAVVGIGQSILDGFTNFFGIFSPSRLMRTEIGYRLIEGIAEGIKEDMSAEEAAKQKAKNIFNAFKEALDEQELTMTTHGLEFQLWETVHGKTATEAEKQAKQLELTSAEAIVQQERVNIAMGEWQQMIEEFGEDDAGVHEAYNRFLKEQINLNKMLNDIEEQQIAMQGTINERRVARSDAMVRQANIMAESSELLRQQGFSEAEIEAWAMEKAGYDPKELVPSATSSTTQKVVQESMAVVADEYTDQTEKLVGDLKPMFTTSGEEYATAIGTGFVTEFETVTNLMLRAVNIMGDAISKTLEIISTLVTNSLISIGYDVEAYVNAIIDMYNRIPFGKRYDPVSFDASLSAAQHARAINASTSRNLASTISGALDELQPYPGQNEGGGTNVYNFTQNNTSPKALTQTEIYRQTNNQFAQLKEALG